MLADLIIKIAGMEAKKEAEYRPRPSSAGPERCLRQLVYRAQGITGKPIGNRFIMVLDDSSWHEELTADWIRKSAFQLLDQQKKVVCVLILFAVGTRNDQEKGEKGNQKNFFL